MRRYHCAPGLRTADRKPPRLLFDAPVCDAIPSQCIAAASSADAPLLQTRAAPARGFIAAAETADVGRCRRVLLPINYLRVLLRAKRAAGRATAFALPAGRPALRQRPGDITAAQEVGRAAILIRPRRPGSPAPVPFGQRRSCRPRHGAVRRGSARSAPHVPPPQPALRTWCLTDAYSLLFLHFARRCALPPWCCRRAHLPCLRAGRLARPRGIAGVRREDCAGRRRRAAGSRVGPPGRPSSGADGKGGITAGMKGPAGEYLPSHQVPARWQVSVGTQ